MKKKELTQLIKDQAGLEFGDRTIALHLTNCFNNIAGQLFLRDINQFNFYTKRITIPVTNRVATLTVPIIQTVGNANGVLRIMPTGADNSCLSDDVEFYAIPSFALKSSVDANNLNWFVGYTVTANTIRFTKNLPKAVTSLLADCVLEFSAYEDDDFIQLPQGSAQMIVDATVASLRGEQPGKNIYKKQ